MTSFGANSNMKVCQKMIIFIFHFSFVSSCPVTPTCPYKMKEHQILSRKLFFLKNFRSAPVSNFSFESDTVGQLYEVSINNSATQLFIEINF